MKRILKVLIFLPGLLLCANLNSSTPSPLSENDQPGVIYNDALTAIKKKDYFTAENKLQSIISIDSHYQDLSGRSVWYQLGKIALLRKDKMQAFRILETGYSNLLPRGKNDWFLNYDLANLYAERYEAERLVKITTLVYDVFKNSSPQKQPELWNRIVSETQFLFKNKDERKKLKKMLKKADDQLGRQLLRFFRYEDPSPLTTENEYLVVFLKRLAEARKRFSSNASPTGFDQRGEIYVRFGKPYSEIVDHSGVIGKVGYQVYPYEFWFYNNINHQMYYTFMRPRGKSYYILADGPESVFGTFYRGRRTFGDRIVDRPGFKSSDAAALAMSLREDLYITLAGQHEAFRDRFNNLNELESSEEKLSYANNNFKSEDKEHVIRRDLVAPAVIYKVGEYRDKLPISYSIARFDDSGNKVRTEIYYGVPYKSLKFQNTISGYQAQLKGLIAIFNENYELIAGNPINETCKVPNANMLRLGTSINQRNFSVEPGNYSLFLSLEDTTGKRLGTVRTDFNVEAFPENTLGLSDIQLASHIQKSGEASQFVKKDYLVVPIPSKAINKKMMLYVYYEIYNLSLNEDEQSNYQLDYKFSTKKKRSFLGKVFGTKDHKGQSITLSETRTSNVKHSFEHIAYDVSRFEKGNVNLEITVTDINNHQQTKSDVNFILLDY